MDVYGLPEDDAHALLSVAADFGVTQVADGNFGVHAVPRKDLFHDRSGTPDTWCRCGSGGGRDPPDDVADIVCQQQRPSVRADRHADRTSIGQLLVFREKAR